MRRWLRSSLGYTPAVFAVAVVVVLAVACSRAAEPPPAAPAIIAVEAGGQPHDIRWSPDGRRVFTVGSSTSGRANLNEARKDGRLQRLRDLSRDASSAALSPDATRVAAYMADDDGPRLVIESFDGRHRHARSARLTDSPLEDPQIVWSPGGDRVLVADGGRRSKILDARTARILGTAPAPVTYLDRQLWSPDGGRIAVPTARGITLLNPLTHSVRRIGTAGDGQGPASWSPDGRFVLVEARHGATLLDVNAKTRIPLPIRSTGQELVWAPDSRRIAYFGVPSTPGRIAVRTLEIGPDGTPGPRTVTEQPSSDSEAGYLLRWSPDGRRLAYYAHAQI